MKQKVCVVCHVSPKETEKNNTNAKRVGKKMLYGRGKRVFKFLYLIMKNKKCFFFL